MTRAFLPMFVWFFASAAVAQNTPEAALAELTLAKDFKSAAKHYPVAVVDALKDLPPNDLAVARNELLPVHELFGSEVTPTVSEDRASLLVLDTPDAKRRLSLRVKRQVSDGATAMLELESCEQGACWGEWRAWLKFEDGEWRLDEITQGIDRKTVTLSDPDLISQLQHAEMHHNEEAAIQALREIAGAASMYANAFKDSGFPEQLSAMATAPAKPGEPAPAESDTVDDTSQPPHPPDPQNAGLLDEAYGQKTCEKDGYRFEYTLLRHGPGETGAFSITATPLDFGKSGSRNFYMDETGVLRVTTEQRLGAATDNPLRESRGRAVVYVQ